MDPRKNGRPQPPPQQPPQQGPPPIFAKITVVTDDDIFTHEYCHHSFQIGPDSGILVVQDTKGDKDTSIYPMSRVKRVVLSPSKLALVV